MNEAIEKLRRRWIRGIDKNYPDISNRDDLISSFDALMQNPPEELSAALNSGLKIEITTDLAGSRYLDFIDRDGEYFSYWLGVPR